MRFEVASGKFSELYAKTAPAAGKFLRRMPFFSTSKI